MEHKCRLIFDLRNYRDGDTTRCVVCGRLYVVVTPAVDDLLLGLTAGPVFVGSEIEGC